jgi:hypothetical protein
MDCAWSLAEVEGEDGGRSCGGTEEGCGGTRGLPTGVSSHLHHHIGEMEIARVRDAEVRTSHLVYMLAMEGPCGRRVDAWAQGSCECGLSCRDFPQLFLLVCLSPRITAASNCVLFCALTRGSRCSPRAPSCPVGARAGRAHSAGTWRRRRWRGLFDHIEANLDQYLWRGYGSLYLNRSESACR